MEMRRRVPAPRLPEVPPVPFIAAGLIAPAWALHQPWLQFFPGFEWLTLPGFLIGLAEAVAYGWYVALVFGWLFNVCAARSL